MNLKVVVGKGQDGYYSAHCPALKSCWSQGRTKEEALQNILIPHTLEYNLALLDEVGFKKREIIFKYLNFVSMVAVK